MLGLIITLIVVGLSAGALARLLVPSKQQMSIGMKTVLASSSRSWAGSSGMCCSTGILKTASCSSLV
jgi:uncharacterized membrane protein YeaQ/YmgE (transglycosylase-associated protein family)